MRFTGTQIAAATHGVLHAGSEAADTTGEIATDTRALTAGAWFIALVGDRFDAHDFADTAVQAGAAGGVFQRLPAGWTLPWVEVADTTVALQDLGRAARARLTVPVVGLTGSSGKTTTRALIACALAPLGRVHQTTGNLNNHLGVPLSLLATPDDAAVVVLEMGTSAPGEIRFLAELARPDVRLVVNVGPAHLQELGGLAGVAVEKGALYDTSGAKDAWVVNADDPFLCDRLGPATTLRYGVSATADVVVADVVLDATAWSTRVLLHTPQGPVTATIPSPGLHIAHNAAAAVAVALALGVDAHAAAAGLGAYAPVGMRQRPVTLPGGVLAINDAYNANPASVGAALQLLTAFDGRKVAVLGDMLELGTLEAELHRQVVAQASASGLDLLVLVGPRMVTAASAAHGVTTWSAEDGTTLAAGLAAWLRAGDRVLFKGSRGARVERVLDAVAAALEVSS